jgi:hypothetical protein
MFKYLTLLLEGSASLARSQRLIRRTKAKADKHFKKGNDDRADELYNKLDVLIKKNKALSSKWDVQRKPKDNISHVKLTKGKNPISAKLDVTGLKPVSGKGRRIGFWELKHKKPIKVPKATKATPNFGRGSFDTEGGTLQTRVANINPHYHGQRIYPKLLRAIKGKVKPSQMVPDKMLSVGARRAWERATGNKYSSLGKLTKAGKPTRGDVMSTRTKPKRVRYKS